MITQILTGIRILAIFSLLTLLNGCATLDYYSQSIQGQFEIMHKQEKISTLVKDQTTTTALRNRLNTVLKLRKFSIEQLRLPENDSYLSYADIGRDFVIWNIFATEEFSLVPKRWCYLIVGCLNYRGYFSKADAKQHAQTLENQKYDVYLGGVAAYSTLGWFNDPILNTMLRWSDIRLATVMFHELAHQQLYINNDTEFNESYADAVAIIGVSLWLQQQGDEALIQKFQQGRHEEEQFLKLIMRYKEKLSALYESKIVTESKRKHKKQLLTQMSEEYQQMSQKWPRDPYKKWFAKGINNAKLAAIVTYRKYVPSFLRLYQQLNNNLDSFYLVSKSLSRCKPMKRKEILTQLNFEFEC